MTRISFALLGLALIAAACSPASGSEVASLVDEPAPDTSVADDPDSESVNDDEAVLAFAACMREAGIEGFEDPVIGGDGNVSFSMRDQAGTGDFDRETMRSAMDECREHLEGVSFGRQQLDRSQIEDQLYEFAACMRDNGYDMPDPDFDAQPGEGGGTFGELDRDDPAFQAALEACQEVFGGDIRLGGPGGGGPGASRTQP